MKLPTATVYDVGSQSCLSWWRHRVAVDPLYMLNVTLYIHAERRVMRGKSMRTDVRQVFPNISRTQENQCDKTRSWIRKAGCSNKYIRLTLTSSSSTRILHPVSDQKLGSDKRRKIVLTHKEDVTSEDNIICRGKWCQRNNILPQI